ncbi:MAG: hypothetical protein C0467_10795 [Planctomycetaceae bacterium]|nr:hypothetical protein [Planctomycetaceae bacterium]
MQIRNLMVGVGAMVFGAVVAAIAQSPKQTNPVKQASGTGTVANIEAAKHADLGTMLAEARTALGKARDYTSTFTRQERLNGALGAEQVGEIKARVSPAGVYVRFARPEAIAGMEVSYSAKKATNKVMYRPAGVAGRKGFQRLNTDDPKFLADNRHPVTDWGMGPIVELIATSTAREKTLNNPVEVYTADFQFANRNVTKYEILTRRPHAFRYAAKMVVYVDKETKLPVRFEAYDEPKAGMTSGDLLEAYSFTDLKLNVGVGENTFE